jgi:hypothetical protein
MEFFRRVDETDDNKSIRLPYPYNGKDWEFPRGRLVEDVARDYSSIHLYDWGPGPDGQDRPGKGERGPFHDGGHVKPTHPNVWYHANPSDNNPCSGPWWGDEKKCNEY